jgi:hypothetical protein
MIKFRPLIKAQTAVRVRLGAYKNMASQDSLDVEKFLAGLHFKQRSSLAE